MARHEAASGMETQLSSCLQNLHTLNRPGGDPVDSGAAKPASNSYVSGAKESGIVSSITEEQNLSNTELRGEDLANERTGSEAFPGHQKNKRILEVKEALNRISSD